jgi:hypothetical protein
MEADFEGDFWADHDEMCHGDIDSDFCKREYPQGYIWDCCDTQGDQPGCERSRHKADPRLKAARRA